MIKETDLIPDPARERRNACLNGDHESFVFYEAREEDDVLNKSIFIHIEAYDELANSQIISGVADGLHAEFIHYMPADCCRESNCKEHPGGKSKDIMIDVQICRHCRTFYVPKNPRWNKRTGNREPLLREHWDSND
tara:strand:+ start:73 stop:480 length:408 start_codon:yes stop_codon:yes gene_type:complete